MTWVSSREEVRDGGTSSFRVKDLLRRGSAPFDMSSICR